MQELDEVSIENLNLSKRICRALMRNRIFTVGDLRKYYPTNELQYPIRFIGEKSLIEISRALEELLRNPTLLTQAENTSRQLSAREEKGMEKVYNISIDVLELHPAVRGSLKKMDLIQSKA